MNTKQIAHAKSMLVHMWCHADSVSRKIAALESTNLEKVDVRVVTDIFREIEYYAEKIQSVNKHSLAKLSELEQEHEN